jgi:hypothetical protein
MYFQIAVTIGLSKILLHLVCNEAFPRHKAKVQDRALDYGGMDSYFNDPAVV